MKKLPSAVLLFGSVSVVAAIAACMSIMLNSRLQNSAREDAHEWIHSQLGLSAAQERALEPIEASYHARRGELEHQLLLANRELADAILADGKNSERVHAAIEKIHDRMGALQKVTIGHVFEMEPVLTREQYRKLLELTAEALHNVDSGHGAE